MLATLEPETMRPLTEDERRYYVVNLLAHSERDRSWWAAVTGVPVDRIASWQNKGQAPEEWELPLFYYASRQPETAEALAILPPPVPREVVALRLKMLVSTSRYADALGAARYSYTRWINGGSAMTPNRQRLFRWIEYLGRMPGRIGRE